MGKIIINSNENVIINKKNFKLGMKGDFKIEFVNNSFGPYDYKFGREDCYFNDALNDRGTQIFPLKNKQFDNTEIFLETDEIVVMIGERGGMTGEDKSFIDIVNLKTEKKHRFFSDEVNLIFNSKDKIVVNLKQNENFKTIVLDLNTLNILEEKNEELQAFFKGIYNVNTKERFILDFFPADENEKNIEKKYKNGYFIMKLIEGGKHGKPIKFVREECLVGTELTSTYFNPWEISNSITD